MSIKTSLIRWNWILSTQFGIDLRKTIRSITGIPRYIRDYLRFVKGFDGRLQVLPCLHDWDEEGGTTKDEYFWQDLIVARKIFEAKPERHVDIGSRVDGFVAHVASFREIEVFDVRAITTQIPGMIFKQTDLMKPVEGMAGYCDSLSCLHALEHFGLGRYGDTIDPKGFEYGLVNMASFLKRDGVFYLSVPIGIDQVMFNAHRIFDPRGIVNLAEKNLLQLADLTVIRKGGKAEVLSLEEVQLSDLAGQPNALGVFTFVKCL